MAVDLLDAVGVSVPIVEDPMLIANEMIRSGEGEAPKQSTPILGLED